MKSKTRKTDLRLATWEKRRNELRDRILADNYPRWRSAAELKNLSLFFEPRELAFALVNKMIFYEILRDDRSPEDFKNKVRTIYNAMGKIDREIRPNVRSALEQLNAKYTQLENLLGLYAGTSKYVESSNSNIHILRDGIVLSESTLRGLEDIFSRGEKNPVLLELIQAISEAKFGYSQKLDKLLKTIGDVYPRGTWDSKDSTISHDGEEFAVNEEAFRRQFTKSAQDIKRILSQVRGLIDPLEGYLQEHELTDIVSGSLVRLIEDIKNPASYIEKNPFLFDKGETVPDGIGGYLAGIVPSYNQVKPDEEIFSFYKNLYFTTI